MMNIISLGAGVQSTTMALMAAKGEITPMPDCAIFADTGSEPQAVYDHLAWLMSGVLPFPVHIISHGNLGEEILDRASRKEFLDIPLYALKKGRNRAGIMQRRCTRNFKIRPIEKKIRELAGYLPRKHIKKEVATVWIGISTDEAARMKPSQTKWIVNRWPLIEQDISREGCLQWLKDKNFPKPPKSACVFCPYKNNQQWKETRKNNDEWRAVVAMDEYIRDKSLQNDTELFLHRDGIPLKDVILDTPDEDNMFNEECEGMCGV